MRRIARLPSGRPPVGDSIPPASRLLQQHDAGGETLGVDLVVAGLAGDEKEIRCIRMSDDRLRRETGDGHGLPGGADIDIVIAVIAVEKPAALQSRAIHRTSTVDLVIVIQN